MVASRKATGLLAACAALCAHGASPTLRGCDPMELIELDIIKPSIAACEATTPSLTARNNSKAERESLCGDKAACGKLLPYLAYMTKNPCVERGVYSIFGGALLETCADFPCNSTDPKLVLVGKPPSSSATTPLPVTSNVPTQSKETKASDAGSQSAAPVIDSHSANSSTPSPAPTSFSPHLLPTNAWAVTTLAYSVWLLFCGVREL